MERGQKKMFNVVHAEFTTMMIDNQSKQKSHGFPLEKQTNVDEEAVVSLCNLFSMYKNDSCYLQKNSVVSALIFIRG